MSRRSAFRSFYNENDLTKAQLAKVVFFNKDTSNPYECTYSISKLDDFDGAEEIWMHDELPASHRKDLRLNFKAGGGPLAAVRFDNKIKKDVARVISSITRAKAGKNFTFTNAAHLMNQLDTMYGYDARSLVHDIKTAMKERRITRTKDLFKFKTNTTKKQAIQPYYDKLLRSMAEVLTFVMCPLNVTISGAAGCTWGSNESKVIRTAKGRFNTIEAFKRVTSANKLIAFSNSYENDSNRKWEQCPKFNKMDQDHIRKLFKDPKATAKEKTPLIVDI